MYVLRFFERMKITNENVINQIIKNEHDIPIVLIETQLDDLSFSS